MAGIRALSAAKCSKFLIPAVIWGNVIDLPRFFAYNVLGTADFLRLRRLL